MTWKAAIVIWTFLIISWVSEKVFLYTFPSWVWVMFFSIAFYFFIKGVIRETLKEEFGWLEDLSDDINDIKRKLGLPTEARTARQRESESIMYIREQAYKGMTVEDFKKEWDKKRFKRWGYWIHYHVGQFQQNKYCLKCDEIAVTVEEDCEKCKTKLVSAKEKKYVSFKDSMKRLDELTKKFQSEEKPSSN